MVRCGFKEQKMWCVSHWQRKMVSYTIFSYRSKRLFSLASSPVRFLLNLLSSATLLPPPLLLHSKALKAEDVLGGVGHTLWLRKKTANLKDTLSSGWVPPTVCTWGVSSDSVCTRNEKYWGFLRRAAGRYYIYSDWILNTDPTYLSLHIPEFSTSDFFCVHKQIFWENITNYAAHVLLLVEITGNFSLKTKQTNLFVGK